MSTPIILRSQVLTPSTTFIGSFNLCLNCAMKRTKVCKKRPGLAHIFKEIEPTLFFEFFARVCFNSFNSLNILGGKLDFSISALLRISFCVKYYKTVLLYLFVAKPYQHGPWQNLNARLEALTYLVELFRNTG